MPAPASRDAAATRGTGILLPIPLQAGVGESLSPKPSPHGGVHLPLPREPGRARGSPPESCAPTAWDPGAEAGTGQSIVCSRHWAARSQ